MRRHYATHFPYPLGAAVGPASCLSFFSKIKSICSTGIRLFPILSSVPTILRICLYKNPFPEKVKVKNCPVSSTLRLASVMVRTLSSTLVPDAVKPVKSWVPSNFLTALTEKGFEVFPTDDTIFQHELNSLRDVEFAGIKIGLLPTVSVAEKALDFIKQRPGVPVVLDPVLVCKETHDVAVSELCQELIRFFPHVSVITPY